MENYSDHNSVGNFSETLMDEDPYQYETYPDDDMESISTESTATDDFSVGKKNQKKKKSNKKKDDIGYRKIKSKHGKLEYFATGQIPGAYIRDPIYGRFTDSHKVGSYDEDLYFKVTYIGSGAKEPDNLYYDNPEQFENHMNCNVKTAAKKMWADKYQSALRNMETAM